MKDRLIPNTQAIGNKRNLSLMEYKDLIFSVNKWTIKTNESKYSSQYKSLSSINNLSGLTFYSLVRFVHKYLQIY